MSDLIPGFSIIRPLGQGSYGHVHLAICHRTDQRVALKLLKPQAEEDAAERFNREAAILWSELKNPHVVDLIGACLEGRPPYIVMEYCAYGSLSKWEQTKRPWADVIAVLSHVVQGLSGIHRAGGFHRDIKPANILLTTNPQDSRFMVAKVADLGLARRPQNKMPTTAKPAGTLAYMAPEIVAGAPYHQPADIFSLGLTGIELLTGQRLVDSLHAIDCPSGLKALLFEMTKTSASQRPQLPEIASVLHDLVHPVVQPQQEKRQLKIGGLAPWLLGGAVLMGLLALTAKASSEANTRCE